MTFEQQVQLILIDKLAIGLLIAIAVFGLNRILEKYRSAQAFQNEIAKQRVSRISEVWSQLYSFESLVSQIIYYSSNLHELYDKDPAKLEYELSKDIAPLDKKAAETADAVRDVADRNRFWLGEDLYQRFRAYHTNLFQSHKAFESRDVQTLQRLKSEREQMKQDVLHYSMK
jgi:hypothetical protein